MKAHWDERYNSEDFAYGENPNVFLTETLPQFTPGKALFAAEGEGRNAVFAAGLGWEVSAFDLCSFSCFYKIKLPSSINYLFKTWRTSYF
jgi:hypothetical protein